MPRFDDYQTRIQGPQAIFLEQTRLGAAKISVTYTLQEVLPRPRSVHGQLDFTWQYEHDP